MKALTREERAKQRTIKNFGIGSKERHSQHWKTKNKKNEFNKKRARVSNV